MKRLLRVPVIRACAALTLVAVPVLGLPIGETTVDLTTQITASADASVNQSKPTTNLGSSSKLYVASSPLQASFLRFDVKGIGGSVKSASLQIYARSASATGYAVRTVSDTTWQENSITFANAPAVSTAVVATSGSLRPMRWMSVDVTSLVTGNGIVNIAVTGSNAKAATLASRESGAKTAPSLVIRWKDTTPPTTPKNLSGSATDEGDVDLSWSSSSDTVGVEGYTIYREGSKLGTVGGTTRSYTDDSVLAGTTHSYTVDAFDSSGNHSDESSSVSVTVPAANTPSPSPSPTTLPPPPSTLSKPTVGPRAVSCSGVSVAAGSSIQAAVDANPTGTTFCVAAGVYRITGPIIPKAGDKLIGQLGAVINGSKLLTGWTQNGSVWSIGGQTQESKPSGVCTTPGCDYNERVYFDNHSLRRASSLSSLASGYYFLDYTTDSIHIADNPSGHTVEASVAPRAFLSWYDAVTIKNLVIEKFATPAQIGSITAQASNWTVENNEVRLNHGVGVFSGAHGVVRGNNIHHNGELGLAGRGINQLVEDNEISYNNTEGFDTNWEGGGTKWVGTPGGLVVRGNYSHDNNGTGLWLDLDNTGALIENNLVEDNGTVGITVEVSCNTIVRNNTIRGTYKQKGLGAAISVGSSHHVEVYGNLVSDNDLGIFADSPPRGSGPQCGTWDLHDVSIHDNRISMNRGYSGLGAPNGDASYYTSRNNRFEGNGYCIDELTAERFYWQNQPVTWVQWLEYGHDQSGALNTLSGCTF